VPISGTLLKTGRGVSGSAYFLGGMNSAPPPMFIDDRAYRHGENVVHRGGVVRTRPGYREVFRLPDGNLQGLTYFRPIGGEGHLVFAVNGNVYQSAYPFSSYEPIPDIKMYEHAERVWFSSPTRSAQRNPDGTIQAIEPVRALLVQDGDYTRCGYWDMTSSGHIDPTVLVDGAGNVLQAGTPLGSASAWSGDRLWVASGNKVFASDIADPYSFTENEYLAEGGFFLFDDDVTALADVPSSFTPLLFVFTKSRTYLIKSGIRDRSKWKSTEDFQAIVFPEIGCVSARSIVVKNGLLWWMSHVGLVSFNSAQQAAVTSKLVPSDQPMLISKANIDPNFSRVALGVYENFILCSVPYGDKYNSHTWVFDQSVASDTKESAESWSGIWTGTRPVVWATGLFGETPRAYYVSKDTDGKNRLWEAFVPDRKDANEEIACFVETKTHIDFSDKATGLDRKRLVYAEVTMQDIQGDVELEILYAGVRGKYKSLGNWHLVATEGSPVMGVSASAYSTYRPQQRVIRTPAVQEVDGNCTSCGIESNRHDWIDIGFSLLVRWTGRASLASYRLYADPVEEPSSGEAGYSESGTTRILSGVICS
jgi:hypothetical protein